MGAIETAMKDARLIDWLRSTAASAGRVASICTGAFLLGETGLLAGRRATTHWSVADRLAKMSPTTRVDRSEEHTSELQSLMRISYAVLCLKKTTHDDSQ